MIYFFCFLNGKNNVCLFCYGVRRSGFICCIVLNLLDERSYLSIKEELKVFGLGVKLKLIKIVFFYWDLFLGECFRDVLFLLFLCFYIWGEELRFGGGEGREGVIVFDFFRVFYDGSFVVF